MGKSKSKNFKRTSSKPPGKKPPPPVPQITPNNGNPSNDNLWSKTKRLLGYIVAIAGAALVFFQMKDYFKSSHEKDHEANIDTGTLKAPVFDPGPIIEIDTNETASIFTRARTDKYPSVNGIRLFDRGSHEFTFVVGQSMWRVHKSLLEKGVIFLNPKSTDDCYDSKIRLILKDNRLYASAEFRDLKDGLLIGKMDYNQWEIYLENKLKYTPNDSTLEVIDHQGYVIFSLAYRDKRQGPNGGVIIRGYFQNPKSILILNNAKSLRAQVQGVPDPRSTICIPKINNPEWKQQAEEKIDKIRSIFDSSD